MRDPYPDLSFGILLKFSIPRSPILFLSCPILAFTYPCRSLAYLYSAFPERSPCARALAISFGRSMFNSCSSWSISPCKRCLIFARGSDMVVSHQKSLPKKCSRSPVEQDGSPDPARTNIIDARHLTPQVAGIES